MLTTQRLDVALACLVGGRVDSSHYNTGGNLDPREGRKELTPGEPSIAPTRSDI